VPFGSTSWDAGRRWLPCRAGIRKTRNGESFGKYGQTVLTDNVNYRRSFGQGKIERLRHEKINPDPYTKRAAGRVAATPALQNKPVGLASCTTQADARCPFEYPHLAVASAYGTHARPPFAPSTSSDTSRADLKSFTEADCHVSSNPYVHRTPATDSRRSADPTSRMGQAKWRIPHVRFVRDVPHGNARHLEATGIQQTDPSSSSRTGTGSNWKLKTYEIRFKASWSYSYSVWG
jgi:hypothetical protein